MEEKSIMNTLKKCIRNRIVQVILIIFIAWLVIGKYTDFVAGSFNNSTPQKAIAEYVYKMNPGLTVFFIDVENQKTEYIPESENKDNYQYYHIVFNGILPIPGDMGGTFKVSKVGNEYFVVEYLGYEGYS